jgi:hypothetical protein
MVVVVEEDAVVVVAVAAVGVDAEPVVAITPAKAVSARIDPQITVALTPDERCGGGGGVGGGGGRYASVGGVQGGRVFMCRTSQDGSWWGFCGGKDRTVTGLVFVEDGEPTLRSEEKVSGNSDWELGAIRC